ncbi:hypothetical protein [Miniphocaeibacter massiliensis]|uniref:hypothetical protein n=1 Tax=Miniphocaeibacter massiliensis TaxID=2041841 RepID=UPI000C079235|nr:hypothetical protein [Miniphocaeibacter massiliensis]
MYALCKTSVILELMQQCVNINAPILNLVFKYNNIKYHINIPSDYDGKEYFDTTFPLDNQEFSTLESFKENALLNMAKFLDYKMKLKF